MSAVVAAAPLGTPSVKATADGQLVIHFGVTLTLSLSVAEAVELVDAVVQVLAELEPAAVPPDRPFTKLLTS